MNVIQHKNFDSRVLTYCIDELENRIKESENLINGFIAEFEQEGAESEADFMVKLSSSSFCSFHLEMIRSQTAVFQLVKEM